MTASNRAGHGLPPARLPRDAAGARASASTAAVDVVLFREDGEAVARRDGEELRFAPSATAGETSGDPTCSASPHALERAWAALANPNAGDARSSRRPPGVEFADLGGRHHVGGGSHGSLGRGDSRGADALGRRRAASGEDRRRRAARARPLRRRAAERARAVTPADAGAWSSDQLRARGHRRRARARGDGARAARALRPAEQRATAPTRTPRCRSGTARRSRSRTWSRGSARRSG